jgi:hypothetical protein
MHTIHRNIRFPWRLAAMLVRAALLGTRPWIRPGIKSKGLSPVFRAGTRVLFRIYDGALRRHSHTRRLPRKSEPLSHGEEKSGFNAFKVELEFYQDEVRFRKCFYVLTSRLKREAEGMQCFYNT